MDHGKMADPLRLILFCALITSVTGIIAHLSYRYQEAPAIRWARGLERESKGAPTLSPATG